MKNITSRFKYNSYSKSRLKLKQIDPLLNFIKNNNNNKNIEGTNSIKIPYKIKNKENLKKKNLVKLLFLFIILFSISFILKKNNFNIIF